MKKNRYFIWLLINLAVLWGFSCSAFAAHPISNILKFKNKTNSELIILSVPNNTLRKVFTLSKPNRLVVDLPYIKGKNSDFIPKRYKGKLIKKIRFGRFSYKISRFVFDVAQPVQVISVKSDAKNLYIEIIKRTKGSKDSKHKKNKKKVEKSEPLPLIIIDAGHGGGDPGAIGKRGTREKDVVLNYARALRYKLLKTKRYRVRLTRTHDTFISLRGRIKIAQKHKASLFISLHADSAKERGASGLSVYTLSEESSDKEAAALAARENKADIIGGMDLSGERADVADILISLVQRETKNNSALLADYLVIHLGKKVRMRPSPHRFAGFAVLKSPDIPSVLIEIGFLSNRKEERRILSKTYRRKIISGITDGIKAYFDRKAHVRAASL